MYGMSFNNKDSTAFFWHLMLIVFNLVNFSWTGCLRPLTMHTVHFYKTNQRCFSSRPAEEVRWMRLCSTAIKKNYTVNMFWGLHCPQFWETTWVKSLRAVQHYEIVVPIFPFTWPDAVCCHCHAHWENHSGWQFQNRPFTLQFQLWIVPKSQFCVSFHLLYNILMKLQTNSAQ